MVFVALVATEVVGRRAGGGVVDVLETLVVPVVAVDVMGPSVVVLFVVLAMVAVVHMLGRLDPKVGVNAREMIVVVLREYSAVGTRADNHVNAIVESPWIVAW